MCKTCGDETIHHVQGERGYDRETCWCQCHDHRDETGHLLCGAPRGDELAAATACERCRWAHAVAWSTARWQNDDRYMQPPAARSLTEEEKND